MIYIYKILLDSLLKWYFKAINIKFKNSKFNFVYIILSISKKKNKYHRKILVNKQHIYASKNQLFTKN